MEKQVNPIPKGYHTVSPILVIRNAKQAVGFYQKAFGAEVLYQQDRPDGKLMHALIKIGDSVLMLGEECAPHEGHKECVRSPADLQGTTINLYLYVKDVDSVFNRVLQAGAEQMMPVAEAFWGDRVGMLRDPYGHVWSVATHTHDLTAEQMQQRMKDMLAHKT